MSQAASAREPWADPPDPLPRRRRREAVSWASAEDLEVLGALGGREPAARRGAAGDARPSDGDTADWMVLTLERDPETTGAPAPAPAPERTITLVADEPHDDDGEGERFHVPAGAPRARRPLRAVQAPPVHQDLDAAPAAPEPAAAPPVAAAEEAPAAPRRTVVIRGRAAAPAAAARRRPARRPSERVAHRPDRVALWAFGLGLLLILVAVLSALGA